MTESGIHTLRIAVLFTVVGFLSISHIDAQTEKDSFALGVGAGPFLFIASGGHETVGGFGASGEPHVDYFLTDEVAVGATGFFYHTVDSDPSQPSVSFGGAFGHINYHFNAGGMWSPYVGGRIGVFTPDLETQFALGIQTGLQYFVARWMTIDAQLDIGTSPASAGYNFLSCLNLGFSFHIR